MYNFAYNMAFVCKQTQSLFQCFDMFICLFLLCICALYFKEGYAHDGSKNCVHQHPKAHDVSKNFLLSFRTQI